jgi:hypothetical protein
MNCVSSYHWLSVATYSLQIIRMRDSNRSTVTTFSSSSTSDSGVFASYIRTYGLSSKNLFIIVCSCSNRLFIIIITNWVHLISTLLNEEVWLSISIIILIWSSSSDILVFAILLLSQTHSVFTWTNISVVIHGLKRVYLWCLLLSFIFIIGVRNSFNLTKLFLRINKTLLLIWQTFVVFQLFKLFLQILRYQLKLFRFWLLSVLVTNSSHNSERINEFIERKTVILRRFRDIHSFSGTRSVVVLLPKLLVFQNYLF